MQLIWKVRGDHTFIPVDSARLLPCKFVTIDTRAPAEGDMKADDIGKNYG